MPSDDFFAEMLTKLLGSRTGIGGTTEAGAQVIASAAAEFGVHPTIVDGSGLSRGDGSSPLEVVDLLRSVYLTPTDYAQDPVAGRLVGLSTEEVAIEREDPRAGTVVVHFPRIGFQIKRQDTEGSKA